MPVVCVTDEHQVPRIGYGKAMMIVLRTKNGISPCSTSDRMACVRASPLSDSWLSVGTR